MTRTGPVTIVLRACVPRFTRNVDSDAKSCILKKKKKKGRPDVASQFYCPNFKSSSHVRCPIRVPRFTPGYAARAVSLKTAFGRGGESEGLPYINVNGNELWMNTFTIFPRPHKTPRSSHLSLTRKCMALSICTFFFSFQLRPSFNLDLVQYSLCYRSGVFTNNKAAEFPVKVQLRAVSAALARSHSSLSRP